MPEDDSALVRFEERTALPMLLLALAIIPLLVIPAVVDLPHGVERTFLALDWFIWAAFLIEYVIRLFLAPAKGRFIASNKLDLLVIVLPFLRPLRAARVLRAVRAAVFLSRAAATSKEILTRHKLHYVLAVTLAVVLGGALLVQSFESEAFEANITNLPDALWWAITTVTTVGYGDHFPTTPAGRGIAVVLMVMGIALFGFLAGSLASFFFEQQEEETIEPKLQELNERLGRIEEELRTLNHKGSRE